MRFMPRFGDSVRLASLLLAGALMAGCGTKTTPPASDAGTPYTLQGTVMDPSGAAISGATIVAGSANTTSAADGSYTLTVDQPTGNIMVTAPGFADLTQAFDLTAPSTELDLTMDYLEYVISGNVRDARGNPVSGVQVSAGTLGAVTTDTTGRYVLDLTGPSGELTVSGVGFAPFTQTLALTAASTTVNVTLQDAAITPMTVGSKWVYQGVPSGSATFSVTGIEADGGTGEANPGVADFTLDLGTEQVSGREYADDSGALFWDSVSLATLANVSGVTTCTPAYGQIAPAKPTDGDSWSFTTDCGSGPLTFDFSVTGPTSLQVADGTTWDTVWQVHEEGPGSYVEDRYYVVGTGFVRLVVPGPTTFDLVSSQTQIE